MPYEPQLILVPATPATLNDWLNATYAYRLKFSGATLGYERDPAALRAYNDGAITIVGGDAVWGSDILGYVRAAANDARLDVIDAASPASLESALAGRIASNQRYGPEPEDPRYRLRMVWPSEYAWVTQPFAANVAYYGQFKCNGISLPGHEGIDLRAYTGSKLSSCTRGTVFEVVQREDGHAYGCRVRVRTILGGQEYHIIFAHMNPGSIVVREGEEVAPGTYLGEADNTGNSFGAHLHLAVKKIGASARGETNFPCDFVDPGLYLFYPGLTFQVNVDALNVRAAPSMDAYIQTVVRFGTTLEADEPHAYALWHINQGDWVKIRTPSGVTGYCSGRYLDVVGLYDKLPEMPVENFARGLHGRADGPNRSSDIAAARLSRMEAYKLTTNAPASDVDALREAIPGVFIMARLYEDFRGGRRITADQFAQKFMPRSPGQQPSDLQRLYDKGVRYFEVHNEPNLVEEGFGASWASGEDFAAWFVDVVRLLKTWYPEAKWGLPGLSPGPVAPGTRPQDMWAFMDECRPAIALADWLGVHHYFKDTDEMRAGIENIVRAYRRRWPNRLVMVTEFSNPDPAVPKEVKGQQYGAYYDLLEQIQGLAAAFGYVVSGSDPDIRAEYWVTESGAATPIVYAVAAAAGAMVGTLTPLR